MTMDFATILAQHDGGSFIIAGLLVLAIWFYMIAASMFWLWMLLEALVHEPSANRRVLWFLLILFLHVIGALIYFFVRRSRPRTVTS
jgi:hypothetical protein